MLEQTIKWSSPLYLLFLDFEEAFDYLDSGAMYTVLCHYGIQHKVINMLKVQYQGFTCQVLHGGTLTELGNRDTFFSPLLFLVVLNWVSKNTYESKCLGLQWTHIDRLIKK